MVPKSSETGLRRRFIGNENGGLAMTEEREELKGKLLLLWLEDLKSDKEPERYPEMTSLTQSEIEEIMSLARFIKGTFYPSETLPADIGDYAKRLATRAFEERREQLELNRAGIQKAANFAELIQATINSLGIDRTALQDSLMLPRLTMSDLEAGKMPPHRLPLDRMVRLLFALRLASKEVVELIRKSSMAWASIVHGNSQTQLGRIDISIKDEERRRLMEDRGDLAEELDRIQSYCSTLSRFLL